MKDIIDMTMGELRTEIDNGIMRAVQNVGINVSKEELIKALELNEKLVRCKDCKYWHDHITTTWCSRGAELRPQESGWIKRNADDFCSYGERETDHE